MIGKQKLRSRPRWKIFPLAFERTKSHKSFKKCMRRSGEANIPHTNRSLFFSLYTLMPHYLFWWMIRNTRIDERRLLVFKVFLGDLNEHTKLLYKKFMRNGFCILRRNDFWFRVVYWRWSILEPFKLSKEKWEEA